MTARGTERRRRPAQVGCRLTETEKAWVLRCAAERGMTVGQYIRSQVLVDYELVGITVTRVEDGAS